jgi:hypothetical protein
MPTDNSLLTPTGQSMYNIIMTTALSRLMVNDFIGSWDAFCTLYSILPPDCKKDCKVVFEEVTEKLSSLPDEVNDLLFKDYTVKQLEEKYLSKKLQNVLEIFSSSLYDKGYTVFVSNRPQTRESSPQDLERMLAIAKYGRKEQ